jgi:HPt (histidine-containing phosphotransfer) domain-containing protein
MSHEVKQYLSLGFTGHLKKPIERQHFFNVLSQYLIPAFNQQFPVLDNKASDLSDLITDFKLSLIKDKAKLLNYNIKEDIDKIAHLVHRLCGAAQMFGFKELSQVAQELDNILKESCSSSIDNQQAMTDLIECLIDEIRLIERG